MITPSFNQNELDSIALPILEGLLQEQSQLWLEESKYRKVRQLQIDKRGSFGERFFSQVLLAIYPRRIAYNDGDQGDWEVKINNIKLEIKTSSIDVNSKFQNESIKKEGDYDGILFLGIKPNELMIKFVKKSEIDFLKLHPRGRRGTGAHYKWDFKESDMLLVSSKEEIKKEFEKVFFKDG